MGRFKVYIKPFDDAGEYVADWTEVTEDVELNGIGPLKQSLDNTEYDVGVFRNNGITLSLINTSGKYSDVGEPFSIFRHRRSNSQVRITWETMHHDVRCGFFKCGMVDLSETVEIFVGLLNDDALKQQADEQNLQFKVLGREGIFSEVKVNYSTLVVGNTFEEILFKILNQTAITDLLALSANDISCGVADLATDAIASLENKTVAEALKSILLYSNSVLYIKDDRIYVQPRTASAAVQKTFYGQGVNDQIENILDISDLRNGLNRTFNFWTWEDTTLYSEDLTSVAHYGTRAKTITTDLITNTTKRQTILDALKTEFANPKRELRLRVSMDYANIALNPLDKVRIDYPNVGIPDAGTLPLWDNAEWDVSKFPHEILPIAIDESVDWKILSSDIDTQNQEIVFYLREV